MLETVRDRAARAMLAGEGFAAAEEIINESTLPGDVKAAIWLYVWSLQSRDEQLRFAEEALTALDGVPAG